LQTGQTRISNKSSGIMQSILRLPSPKAGIPAKSVVQVRFLPGFRSAPLDNFQRDALTHHPESVPDPVFSTRFTIEFPFPAYQR
jgi:hypothetical protein